MCVCRFIYLFFFHDDNQQHNISMSSSYSQTVWIRAKQRKLIWFFFSSTFSCFFSFLCFSFLFFAFCLFVCLLFQLTGTYVCRSVAENELDCYYCITVAICFLFWLLLLLLLKREHKKQNHEKKLLQGLANLVCFSPSLFVILLVFFLLI